MVGKSTQQMRCVDCNRLFAITHVAAGTFCASTMTCLACYKALASKPHQVSCFGKPTVVLAVEGGRRLYGYDPRAEECAELCTDRAVCRNFVYGRRVASALNEVKEREHGRQ